MTGPLRLYTPYMKNGHPVIDTDRLDQEGHVPTHRLDQPTNRQPGESFGDYETRVLERTTWSPDTTKRTDFASLDPTVADSARSLMSAAQAAGHALTPSETGRTQERQEMLFQKGRVGGGQPVTWTLTSDHTPGHAIDFDGDAKSLAWLQANAPAHGFSVMGSMDPGHVSMPEAGPRLRAPGQFPVPQAAADATARIPVAARQSPPAAPRAQVTPIPEIQLENQPWPFRGADAASSAPAPTTAPTTQKPVVRSVASAVSPVSHSSTSRDVAKGETPSPVSGDIDLRQPDPVRTSSTSTPPPQPKKPIELVLAEHANDAMQQGADPHAVTDRLGVMLKHLKANPDIVAHANEALALGADPAAVSGRMWELTQQGQTPGAAKPDVPTQYDGQEVKRGFGGALAQGASFGFSDELTAATKAAIDAAHGAPLGEAYDKNVAAERAALKEYDEEHPVASKVGEIGGAVASALVPGGVIGKVVGGGARAAEGALVLGRGARLAEAAKTGALVGGLEGAGKADGGARDRLVGGAEGAATGAIAGPVADVASGVIAKGAQKLHVPQILSRAAGAVGLSKIADATGTKGAARAEIARRAAMDADAGFTPSDTPKGMQLLPLDRAGPNVIGLAEGVAQRPGAGKAIIDQALHGRQDQMRGAIEQAFDQGTGTTRESGEALLRRLADEDAKRSSATAVAKTVSAEARAGVPVKPNHLDAWQAETGAQDNGVKELQRHIDERSTEANRLYGEARAATKGQPMQSETLDGVRKTPIGQQAFAWARSQMANRSKSQIELATTEKVPENFTAAEWGRIQGEARSRGMPVPSVGTETESAPSPEELHFAKQYLAKVSRLGVHDGAGGTLATQARGALGNWSKIASEMPEPWHKADQAYAARSRVIDQLNRGRDIMRTQTNPPGAKASFASLEAIERDVAKLPPVERQAYRTGAKSAITDRLRNGDFSPKQIAALSDPKSAMSRRVVLATGDADAPAKLAARIAEQPQQLPAAPQPVPQSAESKAASLGLDVLQHPTTPSPKTPQRNLLTFGDRKASMSPGEQSALREGAAQAARGEFAGSRMQLRSPGQVFASSPERVAQIAHAFPDEKAAAEFQQTVKSWDGMQQRLNKLLGGSQTASRVAEESARDHTSESAVGHLLHGNVGSAAMALGSGLTKEAAKKERQAIDAEIARILTSKDLTAVDRAKAAAQLGVRMRAMATNLSAGGATAALRPAVPMLLGGYPKKKDQ